MERWLIRWSQEADNYFIDNDELVTDLYLAIRDIAINNNGWPREEYTELQFIEIAFEAENHTVHYERWETRKVMRVTRIIPGPDA